MVQRIEHPHYHSFVTRLLRNNELSRALISRPLFSQSQSQVPGCWRSGGLADLADPGARAPSPSSAREPRRGGR